MMKCPKCGFDAQTNFCPVCGTPLRQNPYQPPANPVPQNNWNQPAPPLPKKSPVGWIVAASVIGGVVLTGIVIAILSATVFRSSVFDMNRQELKPTVGYHYNDDDIISDSPMLSVGDSFDSEYGTFTLQSVTYGADSALGNDGRFLRCHIEIKNNTDRELSHVYMDASFRNYHYYCEDYYYSLNGEKRNDLYASVTLKPGETAVLTLLCHCPDDAPPSNTQILTVTFGKSDLTNNVELNLTFSPDEIRADTPETTTAAPER